MIQIENYIVTLLSPLAVCFVVSLMLRFLAHTNMFSKLIIAECKQHVGSTGGVAPLSHKVNVLSWMMYANQDDVLQMMFFRG